MDVIWGSELLRRPSDVNANTHHKVMVYILLHVKKPHEDSCLIVSVGCVSNWRDYNLKKT